MKKTNVLMMAAALSVIPAIGYAQQDALAMTTFLTPVFAYWQSTQTAQFLESVAKYGIMIENAISTATNTYNQFQAALRAEEMMLKNLKSVENIRTLDGAKGWVNRQLDLERAATEAVQRTQVSIGTTTKSVTDIADLLESPDRFKVSEGERSQIYQRMGLSPANYAWIQTWKKMEQESFDKSIGMTEAYKEKRKKDAEARAELAEKYQNSGEDGITDNALARDANALQMESISVQEDIRDGIAEMNKRAAIEDMKQRQVPEKARIADTFNANLGKSPVDVSVEELDD
jgi:hypothetical protein